MADALTLRGVSLKCRLGVPDAERRRPQRVLLDLRVETDLLKPGLTDDPRDAVDYEGLELRLRSALEGGRFRLIERLAQEAAEIALAFDSRVLSAEVRVSKTPSSMPKTAGVAADIVRRRP
jgi:dihydroneopterin aldolase